MIPEEEAYVQRYVLVIMMLLNNENDQLPIHHHGFLLCRINRQ